MIKGRNIFENISRIVDDIFNVYVSRIGSRGPFFTEYCDGRQVSCSGLKQWGTVDLANQGYTPLGILKYYYGDNIELLETNNIQDIPQSYPGTPLRLGSQGTYVQILQRAQPVSGVTTPYRQYYRGWSIWHCYRKCG